MHASLPTRPAAGSYGAAVTWHGRIAFVTIGGALDSYSALEGRRLLLDVLEAEPSRAIVDVSDAFVDSSGIGVLVHVAQRAWQERRDFRLLCHEDLAKILHRHELDKLLGVAPVRDERTRLGRARQLAA